MCGTCLSFHLLYNGSRGLFRTDHLHRRFSSCKVRAWQTINNGLEWVGIPLTPRIYFYFCQRAWDWNMAWSWRWPRSGDWEWLVVVAVHGAFWWSSCVCKINYFSTFNSNIFSIPSVDAGKEIWENALFEYHADTGRWRLVLPRTSLTSRYVE